MQIVLNPGSVQNLPGFDGQKASNIIVHAVTLLKNMINANWTMASDFDNKENMGQNAQNMPNW